MQDTSAINRMLASHGLGTLDQGGGLLSQLGFLVQDHEHLRSLLVRCEPEQRSAMYDSLKPYLRFKARPLDVYIAESAERAAQQQLPTIDSSTGILTWPEQKANREVSDAAQLAVNDMMAKEYLTLVCRKCTREQVFSGDTKADAVTNARLNGWSYWTRPDGTTGEICPKCPAIRAVSAHPKDAPQATAAR